MVRMKEVSDQEGGRDGGAGWHGISQVILRTKARFLKAFIEIYLTYSMVRT